MAKKRSSSERLRRKNIGKTLKFLRKVPVVKLLATAGLALALFSNANKGSKTYQEGDDF